jgi:hypothetical protein
LQALFYRNNPLKRRLLCQSIELPISYSKLFEARAYVSHGSKWGYLNRDYIYIGIFNLQQVSLWPCDL